MASIANLQLPLKRLDSIRLLLEHCPGRDQLVEIKVITLNN